MIFPRVRSFISLAISQCQLAIEAHERQQALLPWQPVCALLQFDTKAPLSHLLGVNLNNYDICQVGRKYVSVHVKYNKKN